VAPAGIVKFRTAALEVPALTTEADDPGAPVVTVPTVTDAAAPAVPVGPNPPATDTSICVSPTLAVICWLVTFALIGGIKAPPRSR
jgi:hypothetical protein